MRRQQAGGRINSASPVDVARILPYNRRMSHIEILLPFSLPPDELARDLLRELRLPALSTLLARASATAAGEPGSAADDDGFARSLPHEAWLARRFGMDAALAAGGSPPVAPALMRAMGLAPEPGWWFVLQPVHLHIARDHLVLTDLRQLALDDDASRALFRAALPAFEEAAMPLVYGNAATWFVRADRHQDLQTATPDATCGHNIDIWMPQGASARDWRKLQNAVQMEWHAHAVNETRSAAGNNPVNSLWLWGGGAAPAEGLALLQALFGFDDWFAAFGQFAAASTPQATAALTLSSPAVQRLILADDLIAPALAGDWALWLQRFHQIEQRLLAPLLAALAAGEVDTLSLVLCHGTRLEQWRTGRGGLRKFWAKPALTRLLA